MNNKVCVITGCARGIGRNIAISLGNKGYKLALVDCNLINLINLKIELDILGITSEIFEYDLTNILKIDELLKNIIYKMGGIDHIINNAKAGLRKDFNNENSDNWDLAFAVNVKAVFFLSQKALRFLNKESTITNIGSVSGCLISLESPSYQISKAALHHVTKYIAVNGNGVRSNAILPGFIVQDEHQDRYNLEENNQKEYRKLTNKLHPMGGGPGFSDDIANVVCFLCSKESKFVNGQLIKVDGGLSVQDPTSILMSSFLK